MQADLIIVGAGMVGQYAGAGTRRRQRAGHPAARCEPAGGRRFRPARRLRATSQRPVGSQSAHLRAPRRGRDIGAARLPTHACLGWLRYRTDPFSAETVHAEVLGHIVENRVVQDALLETMQRRGGQRLLGAARLERLERTPQGWQLTLDDGRQLNAPLLVAADGANSAVRRLAGCAKRANGTICTRPSSPVCAAASRISGLPGNASPTTARWRFCRWSVMATSALVLHRLVGYRARSQAPDGAG